jgi:hypothetical protein
MGTGYKRYMREVIRAGRKGVGKLLHRSGLMSLVPSRNIYREAERIAEKQGYHVLVAITLYGWEDRVVVYHPEYEHCKHYDMKRYEQLYGKW